MRLRGEKYKQARNDKRAVEGHLPRWVGTATELAAYCVPANKSDKSFWARFAAANAIFDTIPDGRKQALEKEAPQEKLEVDKCPICGKQDFQKHCYLDCRRPEFEEIREKAHKLQLDEVSKIRRNISAGEGHLLHFASNVVRSAWLSPVDPERLWLGTWNEDTLWRVCIGSDHSSTMDERIPPEELMKLRKIVKALTSSLINAVRALWATRGAILHPNSPTMSRLLIPTRRPQGPSSGAAPKEKPSQSIDEYTVVMEPPTNRSKRNHASHSSDPPPQAKVATQLYFTAYTRRTGHDV
jgi:hypothetical protein